MEYTSLNDLREKFLSYFEEKGHLRLPSFPLVPINDKSLLLINSGMAPMKKYFTGEEEPPCKRVATCQKCIRTPDLENVGITARHGTYFEMLGNFSFGDYFKEEAIEWAWDFLTNTLEIPKTLLWPSVYELDDETYNIWIDKIKVPAERIVKLGKADNFWEHGQGPCGPCSEIYIDRGVKYGCDSPDCKPGCECERFMEIWNNVFSQFNNDGQGNYTELAKKNIDTGMGLERLACVLQGVDNMFEVDTIRKILDSVCSISGKKYGADSKNDISIRIITDHIRSATFMICDGVMPSNEGRGYVLRRLLRRASRHGKLLGINREFLPELCEVVIGENINVYTQLGERKDYILKVIKVEEERFHSTIDAGLSILSNIIKDAEDRKTKLINGDDVFKLYDTFGFPIDLTREIAAEKGLSVDEERFKALMQEQKNRARAARSNISGWSESADNLLGGLNKTEFVGYTETETESKVIAIIADNIRVEQVSEGEFTLVLNKSPFYGESGGQVGDTGEITAKNLQIDVVDTQKTDGIYVHECVINKGILQVGDTVKAKVDTLRRDAIRRNHSSCHLLQSALRSVLGNHIEQAGSFVNEDYARFDFTHFKAMTKDEIEQTENIINNEILSGTTVATGEYDIDEARKLGATALFGEKYGKVVRVVKIGDVSAELCGGTHVDNTSKIGLFKIVSETSVAAGVRRIEAVTGANILKLLDQKEKLMEEVAKELKTPNPLDIAKRAAAVSEELRDRKREIEALNSKLASSKLDSIISAAIDVKGIKFAAVRLDGMQLNIARTLADEIKANCSDVVAVLAINTDGKLNFIAVAGKDAVVKGAHAGKLVGSVSAVTGGKGGGRPDSAMAGGNDLSKIDEALALASEILSSMIK